MYYTVIIIPLNTTIYDNILAASLAGFGEFTVLDGPELTEFEA